MSQRVFQQFINGAFRNGAKDRWFSAMNPYTGKSWATVARAEVEDVEAAVAAARDAFDNVWSRYTGLQRAKLMHRLADLLERDAHAMAVLESTDNGKVIRETQAQMRSEERRVGKQRETQLVGSEKKKCKARK